MQCIGIGCLFLHELPLMYHKLSLIVCFTRISINVPRIVINCLGDIASGCGWLQQPCRADADRCGGGHLWLRLSCSFSLMRSNRRIKADIIGPNAQSGRFPAMSAEACAPNPVEVWRSHFLKAKRPCHARVANAVAGIYGCGIQEAGHLYMKTRHCISGCGRVVL